MRNSLEVFRHFLSAREDGTVDATRVLSRECYLTWLALRRDVENGASGKRFQRTLSNHLGGVDGRAPFEPEEERAILEMVRLKKRWPCFSNDIKIGSTGYRSKGFHERTTTPFKQRIKGLEGAKFTDSDFAANMVQTVTGIIAQYASFTIEAYIQIGNLIRFVFFARTPACSLAQPSKEYATALCQRVTAAHPGMLVLVLNLSARNYLEELCIAQNDLSVYWFEEVEGRKNTSSPFHVGDVVRVGFAVMAAMHNPGNEYPIQGVRFNCRNEVQTAFNGYYSIDRDSYLLVLRMQPADPTATPWPV